jgi:hypothetical protein
MTRFSSILTAACSQAVSASVNGLAPADTFLPVTGSSDSVDSSLNLRSTVPAMFS